MRKRITFELTDAEFVLLHAALSASERDARQLAASEVLSADERGRLADEAGQIRELQTRLTLACGDGVRL